MERGTAARWQAPYRQRVEVTGPARQASPLNRFDCAAAIRQNARTCQLR